MEHREVTYTQARATLASLCDEVAEAGTSVLIQRRNAQDVALISAEELRGLQESAHLLRSPANARRLLRAIERSFESDLIPETVEDLAVEFGLGRDEG